MEQPAPRRSGCLKLTVRGGLVVVAVVLGALAWDVWQLRVLRPPEDRTFEGFVRDGRRGSLQIDAAGDRLYWTGQPLKTVVRYSEPVYEFNRSGLLINWTPGNGVEKGMLSNSPVRKRGTPATFEEARAWLRGK